MLMFLTCFSRAGVRGAMVVLLVFLAACSSTPSHHAAAVRPMTEADCLAGLDRHHIVYEKVKDWQTPEGCGVSQAVKVKASAVTWNHPATMACPLSLTVWNFETAVVQPSARKLLGHSVRKMFNAGSYDCRGERGGRPERLSQHALGRAFDVTGFELDDGTVISVLHDWSGSGAKSEFLHEVAQGACQEFSVVLTPNHNAYHHDHLHFDIGPYKLCGY